MNKQQREYALKRIKEIHYQKVEDIKKPYFVEEKRLTPEQAVSLVLRKKVPVKTNLPNREARYLDLFECFDFSEQHYRSYYKKGWEKAVDKLDKQREKIEDELMLGDTEKALQLIAQFEA